MTRASSRTTWRGVAAATAMVPAGILAACSGDSGGDCTTKMAFVGGATSVLEDAAARSLRALEMAISDVNDDGGLLVESRR